MTHPATIPITQSDARLGCWLQLDKKLTEQLVPWVPLVWDVATIITAPSLIRYEFDQASSEISLDPDRVSDDERMP